MSGGHFDYSYMAVNGFCRILGECLELKAHPYGAATTERLEMCLKRAKDAAELMRAVEWLFSEDDSEETFMEETEGYFGN
jgi:hypothetical protein